MGTKYGKTDYQSRMGRFSPSQRIAESLLVPRHTLSRFTGKRPIAILVLVIAALYVLGHLFERRPVPTRVREGHGVVYQKEIRGSGPDREYVVGVRIDEADGRSHGLAFTCPPEIWTQLAENDDVTVTYRVDASASTVAPISLRPGRVMNESGPQPGAGGSTPLSP